MLSEVNLSIPRRVVKEYLIYTDEHRTYLGLNKDAPHTREIESRGGGNVVALPFLGGLHHRYSRLAGTDKLTTLVEISNEIRSLSH